ncbi:stalk domain-containing protein [Oscillospiraceae bacterium WX1]
MKKPSIKGFIIGVISSITVFALVGTALATSGTFNISVSYKNIKLFVDGVQYIPKDATGKIVEPFTYNGTTYLPARAVATALGKDVTWVGDTNTVYIGAVPGTTTYNRTNPAPIGTEQTITTSSGYTVSVKINNIVRGSQAWQLIQQANMFNGAPSEGYEYIVVNATVSAKTSTKDTAYVVSYYDFDSFSKSNTEYTSSFVVPPDPILSGDIYPGGSFTGNFVVMVKTDDPQPKTAYCRSYDGSGGLWFALY